MIAAGRRTGGATRPGIAYVLDPRFPGGTSSAVAAELGVTARLGRIRVHALDTRMFHGREVAPGLAAVLDAERLEPVWDAPTISADLVILHNPACLKFQDLLGARIVARHLVVVTHENFLRPGGAEAFDVARCLGQIDRASLALRKSLAPVSALNRATIEAWDRRFGLPAGWSLTPEDWFNICDFPLAAPTASPRDRRGRHSRPGFEKFPGRAAMDLCFPAHAEDNVILGADLFIADETAPPHWTLHGFKTLDLKRYFEMIDFMVYFTAPTWRESFGRVLAEGIAAGKVVISDPATASAFDGGVVAARPDEVDGIIRGFVAAPERYRDQVTAAQAALARYSAEAFGARFRAMIAAEFGAAA